MFVNREAQPQSKRQLSRGYQISIQKFSSFGWLLRNTSCNNEHFIEPKKVKPLLAGEANLELAK